MSKKIVLAFSGGLDTTVIAHFLIQRGFTVIGFLANLGQTIEDLTVIQQNAQKIGLTKLVAQDLQQEFLHDFVLPGLTSAARYENYYLLGTALARPLIAQAQVKLARKLGAEFLAHGATGKGNDQIRFELTWHALNPSVKKWIPWREPDFYQKFGGRREMLAYARKFKLPVKASKSKPWSSDENLLHISFEAGVLEDLTRIPPTTMFELTKDPLKAPNKVTKIKLDFECGLPSKLNGKKLPTLTIFKQLNRLGGLNAIGRVDLVENRFLGLKSRGIYETPGGTILWHALRLLESLTIPAQEIHARDRSAPEFAELIYNGFWFSKRAQTLLKQIKKLQQKITGAVELGLYKGNVIPLKRSAPNSLYDAVQTTFESDGIYRPTQATKFIQRQLKNL